MLKPHPNNKMADAQLCRYFSRVTIRQAASKKLLIILQSKCTLQNVLVQAAVLDIPSNP